MGVERDRVLRGGENNDKGCCNKDETEDLEREQRHKHSVNSPFASIGTESDNKERQAHQSETVQTTHQYSLNLQVCCVTHTYTPFLPTSQPHPQW